MNKIQDYFVNKNIIVTGAGGGIGLEICKLLSDLGANVYATDISLDTMNALKKNQNVHLDKLDVRLETSWNNLLKKFQKIQLDGLIQCAGVLRPGYVYNFSPKDIDFHFDINLKGLVLGSNLASKIFKKQNFGHIVHIASLAGLAPIPGMSLYSASKFAVRAFSLAIAQELKQFGITVSVVCPDAVRTPMLDLQKDKIEAALTFSGSTLSPEYVAKVVLSTFTNTKLEIALPYYRGVLAKFGNNFPGFSSFLYSLMIKLGLSGQKKYQIR